MTTAANTPPYAPLELVQLKHEESQIQVEISVGEKDGFFGEVKQASLDKLPCTAKLFKCDITTDEERVKIEQDLQVMTAFKHPNLVQIYTTFWNVKSGKPILVMELLKESLPQFLKRQEVVPYYIKVNLCHDIALALSYLHINGFIHGDLTSNNVLIVGESRAKVTDYWMSKVRKYGKMKEFTEIVEKLPYLSPEQKKSPANISIKSDAYSFGIIVSEIDTATVSSAKIHNNHSILSIPSLPAKSPFHDTAVRCLSTKPDFRPTFDEICSDLESMTDHRYERSVQESRHLRSSIQHQFVSQLDDLQLKVSELQVKFKVENAKLIQQQDMVDHLLKKNRSLSLQLLSVKANIDEESSVKDESIPLADDVQQEKIGTIENDNLNISSCFLGEGKSGKIYQGRWHSNDIAFKRFLFHQNPPDKWLTSYKNEALILTSLSHRNILKILYTVTSPGNIGIVMELMNKTLHELLFNSSAVIRDSERKRIVRHIGFGMEYLHDNGIYHGKFSSYNVLVSCDGVYKVSNFGPKCTQKNFRSYYIMESTSKSFVYSAPEILRGDILSNKQFQRADVYSLAMVVYEVMSGKHCFSKSITKKELASMVIQHSAQPEIEECVDMPQDTEELLRKCWDGHSRNRPTARDYVITWNQINN